MMVTSHFDDDSIKIGQVSMETSLSDLLNTCTCIMGIFQALKGS